MKRILDPCCGSRMFWFDKENPDVEFCDIRELETEAIWKSGNGKNVRYCTVKPDRLCSVTDLPFEDNIFWHIVLDPPPSYPPRRYFMDGKEIRETRQERMERFHS